MSELICGQSVSWWDGEYDGECELPKGHQGPHYDGMSCFTDDGDEVELISPPIKPLTITITHYQRGQIQNQQTQVLNGQSMTLHMKDHLDTVITAEIAS